MKKNVKEIPFFCRKGLFKTLLIMKLTLLLSFSLLFVVQAEVLPQGKKLSIDARNSTVREILTQVEENSDYRFFYNDKLTDLNKLVDFKVKNMSEFDALNSLFEELSLTFQVLDNKLVLIIPKENLQEITVKGKVADVKGNPLPGVNIIEKGTTNGTITDINGEYTISVNSTNSTLSFSYIGFLSEDVEVVGRTIIDLTLIEDIQSLEEVVVIGYGIQKKVNLTGSVGNVEMDDMEGRPLTNTGLALQGTIPGVYALQNSGQPGDDGAIINIRGVGTFGDSSPLILIDGIPANINDVNPNDIESISVLKDAASSAIYGNRAANGVILITTKRGTEGKMKVSYSGYLGTQEATSLPDVLNSVDYAKLYNEANINSGATAVYTDEDIQKFAAHNDPLFPDINYFDVYYGKANMQNHRLNVTGGNENVLFAFMLGHLDQEGILVGTSYKKTDFRSNIDAYFLNDKKLRVSAKIAGNAGNKNEPTDIWNAKWYATNAPVTPLVNPDGNWMANNGERNFYGEIKEGSTSIEKRYNMSGLIEAEYNIIDGLSALVNYGYNIVDYNKNAFHANVTLWNPDGSSKNLTSDLTVSNGRDIQTMLTSLLKYNKSFGMHEISLLAGYSEEEFHYSWESGYRSSFVNNTQRVLNLGDASSQTNDAGSYDLGLRSYFGRVNYVLDSKYLFEANIRKDGSSRFSDGNKWGTFPSFSAGWIISNEEFMQNIDLLNMLKFRASWGRLGNEHIVTYYNGSDKLSSGRNYSLGGTLYSGVAVTDMTNKALTWETSEQQNIGIDLMLNNGIEVTLDYFDKRTKDLLKLQPIPKTMALGYPYANAGEVKNQGIEASVTYRKTFANGIKLRTTLNMSHIVNEITKLDVAEEYTSPKAIIIGNAINSFYGYKMDGIYQLSDFNYDGSTYTLKPGVVSIAAYDAQPGDIKYKDISGDGVININDDRTVIGKQFPDLSYALNVNLEWKQFDLGVFLQGVKGIDGYTYYEISTPFSGFANMGSWWLDRWTPDNPSNTMPRITTQSVRNDVHSTFYMEDASYLRMKNIELGYTVNQNVLSKVGMESVRIYGSIQNAFTITDYKGFDPEQNVNETRAQAYPQVRIMTLGVNINF